MPSYKSLVSIYNLFIYLFIYLKFIFHFLQGQLYGTYLRISILKLLRKLVSFIFTGTISETLAPN